jgi:hypothetical protein
LHSTHTSLSLMLHQNHISANRTKIEGFWDIMIPCSL